jgi:predicted nuclease of predicted toxin-antitoxin system
MKLLFDENLSPRLPRLLAAMFPDSRHVRDCGLLGAPDHEVWRFALEQGFVIISKDADFYQRTMLYGSPPKVIWLRVGNCTTHLLHRTIIEHEEDLRTFEGDPVEALLVLS